MNKIPAAVRALIIANVLIFAIGLIPNVEKPMFDLLAMWFPKNPHFQYWQIVTSMFLHGGWAHILLNMYGLWAFGSPIETMWGKKKLLIFYFVSGIGASIIYLAVNYYHFTLISNELMAMGATLYDIQNYLSTGNYNAFDILSTTAGKINSTETAQGLIILKEKFEKLAELFYTPAVGASGAIYGVLVAFGMSFPNAKLALIFLPVPIPAKFFIPILIGIDLFSGVTGFSIFGGGIAHFAHVGGALVGFLLVWYWKSTGKIQVPVQYYQNQ